MSRKVPIAGLRGGEAGAISSPPQPQEYPLTNGKEWGPEHTSILWEMHATHHDHEIGERTGHDTDTVQRRRQALGLPAFYGSKHGSLLELPPASLAAIKRAARIAA